MSVEDTPGTSSVQLSEFPPTGAKAFMLGGNILRLVSPRRAARTGWHCAAHR
jgi:hypothetical protein